MGSDLTLSPEPLYLHVKNEQQQQQKNGLCQYSDSTGLLFKLFFSILLFLLTKFQFRLVIVIRLVAYMEFYSNIQRVL